MPQPFAAVGPLLRMTAKAVAWLPTWTERLDGSTAASRALVLAGVLTRPILLLKFSVNHRAPSGPGVIPHGSLLAVGIGNSVMAPVVVMRPILLLTLLISVNHRAPSGPTVIPRGPLLGVGTGNSVMLPVVVMRPILLPVSSVNHSAPSGPAVMPMGALPRVGMGNSVKFCASTFVEPPAVNPNTMARAAPIARECRQKFT